MIELKSPQKGKRLQYLPAGGGATDAGLKHGAVADLLRATKGQFNDPIAFGKVQYRRCTCGGQPVFKERLGRFVCGCGFRGPVGKNERDALVAFREALKAR